jgi:hypothetical protein
VRFHSGLFLRRADVAGRGAVVHLAALGALRIRVTEIGF